MKEGIDKLNVVIAELNLAVARLSAGAKGSDVAGLLDQAKKDLAQATRTIGGQSGGGDDT